MIEFKTLEQHIPLNAAYAPLLREMFTRNEWLLRPMLEALTEESLPAYFKDVTRIWDTLLGVRNIDPTLRIVEVISGLQFHSMEFLKLQIQFAKTGIYKSSDAETIESQIYQAGDKMQRYLDGLLLTYVAWPNHYRLLNWYRDAYLRHGPYGSCLEIGPGHGYLALEQLQASEFNTLVARDLSPHSVAYTQNVLRVNGIDPSRYDVRQSNAQKGLDTDVPHFDRIVIAEVIEHVADPLSILQSLSNRSHKETLLFITTVVNIEAPDHIYLFRTLQEVRDLLSEAGMKVVDELDLPLNMNLILREPAYEVAMVCKVIS